MKAFRESGAPGEIGIVWNLATPRPATNRPEDLKAAERSIDKDSRMFTGPVFGKGYPVAYLKDAGISLPIRAGDMETIAAKIDFVGLNYYMEAAVVWDESVPGKVRMVAAWQDVTDIGWPITPDGFYRLMKWLVDESDGRLPIYITENGCTEKDLLVYEADSSRRVRDVRRIDYLRSHLESCARARAEGVLLAGYFVWSLIDNFEWSWGYSKRFGIVYCDYQSLECIPKDSYYFYRDVIAGYMRCTTPMPSRSRPVSRTRAVRAERERRLSRSCGSSALRTGQAS